MVPYIIGGIVLLLIIWLVASYNGFVRLRNSFEEAFSTMDVYLKKRYNLIPNLVETVKGYASHEQETLSNVVKARNVAASATSVEGRIEGENALQSTLKSLFALAEAYPDLKANTNFLELQADLRQIEDEIANSRKYYNAVVKTYNTKREVFPSVIVAGLFGFGKKPLFEVSAETEREAVRVKF